MDLLEREAALDTLVAKAAGAYAGRGEVVCVVAPAGVGKTSVLRAARERLSAAGLRVLATTAGEQERSLPHGVTRALLEPALARPERARVLSEAAAPAGVLFDGGVVTGPLHHALYWTVANLALEHPLAVVLDDAHWADDATLETLAYLARRIADLPLLLVVATRPDAQSPWPAALAGLVTSATELTLSPLSAGGTATFVTAALGRPPTAAFAAACHEATGGVPFYLHELTRDVVCRGLDPDDAQASAVGDIAPAAIVRSVLLRLAGLGPAAPALARTVAVLGDGARLADAAALAYLDPDAAAVAADALAAGGLLADSALGFAHPILRRAVLDDIGRHERARLHARAARILAGRGAPVGVVASHLLSAEPEADPWVCATLLEAAQEATANGSPETAAVLLRRAQQEPPPADAQADHLFALGVAEAALGDLAALGHLEASMVEEAAPAARAERALVIGELARKAGLAPVGIAALDAALSLLRPESPEAALAAMERHWIARTTVPTVEQSRADRPALDRGLAHADPGVRRRAAAYLALEATLDGTSADVDRYLAVALAPPGLLRVVDLDAGVLPAALYTLTTTERHAEFERLSSDLLAEAGRTGNGVGYGLATVYRGTELLRLGRLADAELEVEAAMDWATEAGWPKGSPELVAVYLQCRLWRGDLEGAERALRESPFALSPAEVAPIATLLDARGQVALARGDLDGALADFREAGACLDALGLVNPGYVAWRSHLAEALRRTGDVTGAAAVAQEELTLARRLSGPAARAGALRQLAAALDRPQALVALEEAADVVAGSPAALERALVDAALGPVLRRTGRKAEAADRLRRALDLATRCDMTVLVERVRAELLAAGARPRRVHLTGPDSLTAAERRVARLAADGMTNTVIAQTLFVSRKTVEKHLANAYGKLAIRSRAELAGVDLDQGAP